MKILFTGASSFTGYWFVQELSTAGHEVVAFFRSPYENYSGLRKERIDHLQALCKCIFNAPFGSEAFLSAIQAENGCDLFCHHAAEVGNYKSSYFDPIAALSNNTHNLQAVLNALNTSKIILTGSVFEPNEGTGPDVSHAVSPYGLSKGLTSLYFRYYAASQKIRLGKFVIPNPFGPYEEERFTTYLAKSWYMKEIPIVNTPEYVRDNVPVTLLAKAYRKFAEDLPNSAGYCDIHPSFYAESQANFTKRFATELQKRLQIPCEYTLKEQPLFLEPKIRINHDVLNPEQLGWSEEASWDQLCHYYEKRLGVLKLNSGIGSCPTP